MSLLAEALNDKHHFAVSEKGRGVSEWVQVVPAMQWAPNSTCTERIRSTASQVMIGRGPPAALLGLVSPGQASWMSIGWVKNTCENIKSCIEMCYGEWLRSDDDRGSRRAPEQWRRFKHGTPC